MPTPEQKFDNAKEVVSERPEMEVDAAPLGGEGEDVPVDLDAEKVERDIKSSMSEQTKADIEEIRTGVLSNQREEMRKSDSDIKVNLEKKPFGTTIDPATGAEDMLTRSQMNRLDKKKPWWKFWG